ncbi:stage III sporulation protein AD [Halobacteroides halobius DSM 5150]|uniref:Stage III sporulation protein AD n=1 Tax=Halobacteroides halobius (strain ATCC 35273 / DSM 5150 / MD-1) TaxID=748449 RepID=L0K7I8_HALHC|nr:stage III sporulation protein AD [Halobacteroides halobius]AGB40510.1 stage III sporulation protein AD [Halobacteroides halobius DSM 5150]
METIIQIVGLGVIGTIFAVVLKQSRPELALQLSLVVGLMVFIFMLSKIMIVINALESLADKANVDKIYLSTILKAVGIAYVAEFGAQICRDAGEGIIASKIEFAGKVLIMILGIPIMMAILESVLQLLP